MIRTGHVVLNLIIVVKNPVSCRPVRKPGFEGKPVKEAKFTEIPNEANEVRIAFLPPMSGLAAVEPKLEPCRLNVLFGRRTDSTGFTEFMLSDI